eukprot:COSAG01_NODE_10963_length_2038_cov_15.659336_2_plen_166_part_00
MSLAEVRTAISMKAPGQVGRARGCEGPPAVAAAAAEALRRRRIPAPVLTDWGFCAAGCLALPRPSMGACVRSYVRVRTQAADSAGELRSRHSVGRGGDAVAQPARAPTSSPAGSAGLSPSADAAGVSSSRFYCSACRKSFGSAVTLQNHHRSKKHKLQEVTQNTT